MDYKKISTETTEHLHAAYKSLKNSPLEPRIRALVELRASQLNNCAYCCDVHSKVARKEKVSQNELDQLMAWKSSSLFSQKERLALQWCEEVTLAKEAGALREKLEAHFSERELVDLTLSIALMNTFNRLRVYLAD